MFSCSHSPFVYIHWRNVDSDSFSLKRVFIIDINSSLYIINTWSFPNIWFENIFSHTVDCHLIFFFTILRSTEIWNFYEIQFIYLFFGGLCFGAISKKRLPIPRSPKLTLAFSSKNCMVLALAFRSLIIHFELLFIYGVRQGVFIFLHVDAWLF